MSEATPKKGLHARIISASVVLLSGSTLALGINLAYNVAVAHLLGTAGFGNASALYTLLTLMSAVTLSFQIVTSKIVVQQPDQAQRDAAFIRLERAAWAAGMLAAGLLIVFQQQITNYLDLPAPSLVVILAAGVAFYVPLGARRGYVQGAFGFGKFATNLVLEGGSRLFGSVLMIMLGFGVAGVIAANAAAMAISYLALAPKLDRTGTNPLSLDRTFREVSYATVFFAGQVLINNCDIVLVKHFFNSGDAGLYAAISMVGRVTFACSNAIVNGMFPVVAGSKREERKSLTVVGTALLMVVAVCGTISLVLLFLPPVVWTTLFGKSFQIAGPHGFPYLLALYGLSTLVYCCAVVVMTYEMAYKIANTTWYQIIFSGILIAGICKFHSSLQQVIMVQLVLLLGFMVLIGVPFVLSILKENREGSATRHIRKIRPVSEDEAISEFLRSDFEHEVYGDFRETHRGLVINPNLEDESECSTRRALLALRHRALWRELPADTQWFQVRMTAEDLPRIRVFPRAQWTRVARGNYAILKVAERLRGRERTESPFVEKISDIREVLSEDSLKSGSVILIGESDSSPLTAIDGNHRFVAAVLEGKLDGLTFLCGLSPNMVRCCWYRTNIFNLARYGYNLLRNLPAVSRNELNEYYKTSGQVNDGPLNQSPLL